MHSNVDLRIKRDAFNYLQEAADDDTWRKRADEVRKANGGMCPQEWGCLYPMPSLARRRHQTTTLQPTG